MNEINVKTDRQSADLIAFSESYINNCKKSKDYKASCRVAFRHLKEFSDIEELTLFTDSIHEFVLDEFVYFLQNKQLKLSTINNIVSKIKYILKKADKRGFAVNYDFEDFTIEEEEVDTVSLTITEIKAIHALENLTTKQKIIRDYFSIGCLTGLRFSDYSRLQKEHFVGHIIKIRTKKTRRLTEIPMHAIVLEILEHYNFELPPLPSVQYFNQAVKTIARKAGLTQLLPIERQVGHNRESLLIPKCELISSHTGRRSMVTNMFLAGLPTYSIMLISGHTSEKSFFRYVRVTRAKNAIILSESDYFKGLFVN